MSVVRAALLFAAGVVLYNVAVVFGGGVLAAASVPRAYFDFFGAQHRALALGVLNLTTWALPVALLVFVGALLALLPQRVAPKPAAASLLAGMFAAFLYWHASSSIALASAPNSLHPSFVGAFLNTLLPAWWAVPNLLAPWLGAAAAVFALQMFTGRQQAR
jgi:hypothetical protein